MFQGSLCGQWPALPVFCTLLPLADKDGVLDCSYAFLSATTGWPEDLLRQGVAQLEQPDPQSRTPDDDGRRLIRLRDNTDWGWRLVNHAKYREKARLMAKNAREVAEGRNAERMADRGPPVTAADRRRPPVTAGDPLSNANTNSNSEGLRSSSEGTFSSSSSERAPRTLKSEGNKRQLARLAAGAVKWLP